MLTLLMNAHARGQLRLQDVTKLRKVVEGGYSHPSTSREIARQQRMMQILPAAAVCVFINVWCGH